MIPAAQIQSRHGLPGHLAKRFEEAVLAQFHQYRMSFMQLLFVQIAG